MAERFPERNLTRKQVMAVGRAAYVQFCSSTPDEEHSPWEGLPLYEQQPWVAAAMAAVAAWLEVSP